MAFLRFVFDRLDFAEYSHTKTYFYGTKKLWIDRKISLKLTLFVSHSYVLL